MWVWYFILSVVIAMAFVEFIGSRQKKPFPGFKALIPQFNQETGEELTPHYKNKSQMFIEKITGTPIPYFETTIDLYEKNPQELVAEWTIGDNFKNYLTKKYGQEFWHNSQPILRINHSNGLREPYHQDVKIDLNQGLEKIQVNTPGETINSQVGVITETGSFIPFAQSNDVTIPKQ